VTPVASPTVRTGRDRALIAVVLVAVLLNGLGLWWGLPLNGTHHGWDIDGIAPIGPLVAAKKMILEDWWNPGYYNKYPMGHFFLLMAAYAPYVGYLWLTGDLRAPTEHYPFGLADPATALTVLALIARAISAIMGVGIVVLVYLTAKGLAGRRAAVFSALTIAASPAFVFYAHTGNIDTPSLFWSALALFALGLLLQGHDRLRHHLLLGVAVGMAAATKEQAVGLFLLLPVSLVLLAMDPPAGEPPGRRPLREALFNQRILAGAAAALLTFVLATHLIFNWDGNLLRLRWRIYKVHPTYGTEYPGARIELEGLVDGLVQMLGHTWDVMNPVLLLAAAVGVVVLPLHHRWARHMVLPLVSYSVLTLAMLNFFRARFVMQLALVLALFAGPALGALWASATARNRLLLIPLAVIGLYSFARGAEITYLMLRDTRYDAEAWMRQDVAPGTDVEVYTETVYLPRFPSHVQVHERPFTESVVAGVVDRSPDLIVMTSAHHRQLEPGTPEAALAARLLRGDFGYRPVRTFRREPVIARRMIPTLSPEIVVLRSNP
jgi:hypothetical protein